MPIIRNPFRRAVEPVIPENAPSNATQPGLSRKSSEHKSIDLKTEPVEYKLSEINDNGDYLPPSPTEKKSFWSTRSSRSGQSSRRNILDENEPFNISRESFDSYRRSFDIGARTPIVEASPSIFPRQSLDVRHMRMPSFSASVTTASSSNTPSLNQKSSYSFYTPRFHTPSTEQFDTLPAPATSPKTIEVLPPTDTPEDPEEQADKFEEVGLNDPKPRHRSIFARFTGTPSAETHPSDTLPKPVSSGGHNLSFFGRKRGQSGTGSELGSMTKLGARPASSGKGAMVGTPISQSQTPSRNGTPVSAATPIAAPTPATPATSAPAQPTTVTAPVSTPMSAPPPVQQTKVDA